MDIAGELFIDYNNLEEECSKHSSRFYYWTEKLADAEKEKEKEENALKAILGRRELAIREDPPRKMKKITESVVSAMLASDPIVIEQRDRLAAVRGTVADLKAIVSAFEHRRSDLKSLVTIWETRQWGDPASRGSEHMNNKLNK